LKNLSSAIRYISPRWEILFFFVVIFLLSLQVFSFYADIRSLAYDSAVFALFVEFQSFVARRLAYVTLPLFIFPLAFLFSCKNRPTWARLFLDFLGAYVFLRLVIQLIGLNILVFDSVTPRFLLISQLLFFLPYLLLVWGWVYWRLDTVARECNRPLFLLDCERFAPPRPVDYFIASFSSVFSVSINAIKGNSARARILLLSHGFMIYDIMGLTLSRAIDLVQTN
jgi:hypothetical protein